ncbi:hypothetical protein [Mycoplasma phocimorsus]|uniref:LacI family transcriptional regulator n=1 Tax=Mycoplasma phocimorsus TaxID=3045839 RepID=A0AAJ1PRP5_9MOLU|nr:hypothetical protein [Mycoplasma phocimorsus]MDJ1645543.1 hypothetical protein [Mycoplasma phocimorsus]MDJ1646614.1 hypothetical protein [Mycoplasma phocimorsus]MDJ1647112.1 hypothetical protein [Mycoplasma phocimorsus]MDJ1647567.1 hypothetical protein [Mycoplasma phocimorsus]MDJ1648089.1 hypothetical protein [Mycoplasma phocimorsus]
MNKLTYKKIADRSGISISSISRYYNNGYISESARKKIEFVISEYYKNQGSSRVDSLFSNIVLLPFKDKYTTNEIVKGIENAASIDGEKIFILRTSNEMDKYIAEIEYLINLKPKSLILFPPVHDKRMKDFLKQNSSLNICVYGYDYNYSKNVLYNYEEMFYKLVKEYYKKTPCKKMMFLIDSKVSADIKNIWVNSFRKATQELEIIPYIVTIDRENIEQINSMLTFLEDENVYDVIVSSHDIFTSILAIQKNKINFNLTDIGYFSKYDYNKKYKAKIFIDYQLIGVKLYKLSQTNASNKETSIIQTHVVYK